MSKKIWIFSKVCSNSNDMKFYRFENNPIYFIDLTSPLKHNVVCCWCSLLSLTEEIMSVISLSFECGPGEPLREAKCFPNSSLSVETLPSIFVASVNGKKNPLTHDKTTAHPYTPRPQDVPVCGHTTCPQSNTSCGA